MFFKNRFTPLNEQFHYNKNVIMLLAQHNMFGPRLLRGMKGACARLHTTAGWIYETNLFTSGMFTVNAMMTD